MVKQKSIASRYPKPHRDRLSADYYHDMKVRDPYRWLEDPHAIETRDFIVKQNEISQTYLEDFKERDQIREKIRCMLNYPKRSVPIRSGTKYYQRRNSGLLNQNIFYVSDSIDTEGSIFLDPNKISPDGTASLRDVSFSTNGEHMAYSISISGSEWMMVKIRNTRIGEDLIETLYKIKASKISWNKFDTGFFYSGYLSEKDITYFGIYTKVTRNQKIYFHRLNQDQDSDAVVCSFDDPQVMVAARVSTCGEYLVVYGYKDCKNNSLHIASLCNQDEENYNGVVLYDIDSNFDCSYSYVTNTKNIFLFKTNKGAPNSRLVSIKFNPKQGEERILTNIIKEHPTNVLEWVKPINHTHLIACYLVRAEHRLELFSSTGIKMMDINITPGTIFDVSGEYFHDEMFFSVTNFFSPNTIYRLDLSKITPEVSVIHEAKLPGLDQEKVEVKKLEYPGKDGVMIPLTIYHLNDIELNGNNPCLLNGYGGFGVALTPSFKVSHIIFALNFHGVCAYAHVRGGGEYGEKWHLSGSHKNKQNSFDDFQCAARYLIENNYTQPKLITVMGESNGALLSAVSINQAPDLFGSAVLSLGIYDMIRYNRFTSGYTWVSDFGTPDNKEDFDNLLKYSPLHNIKAPPNEEEFPACLLITADHDDLVVPAHSLKYMAELQYKIGQLSYQSKPLLLKVEMKAGHGTGKPTSKCVEEMIDTLTFIAKTLDIKFYEN